MFTYYAADSPYRHGKYTGTAHLPPKERPHPGAHSGMLPGADHVTHPATMDGRMWSGHSASKIDRGNGRSAFSGRGVAYRRRPGYPFTHRKPTRRTSGLPASKAGVSITQQTKINQNVVQKIF